MKSFLQKWKRYFWFAFLFSLFINTLQLTFPVYMLIIFDKVLASRSLPTLYTVSLGAAVALMVMGSLDFLRSRLLVRAGVAVDAALTRPVITGMIADATRPDSSAYREGIPDINMLRNFLAGNAAFSFFDLPWSPIYVFAIYAMNAKLGWLAILGVTIALIIGLAQEALTGKRFAVAKAMEREAAQLVATGLRNAEAITAMGMTQGLINHWLRPQEQALLQQTNAYRYSGMLSSFSRSFRLAMQVFTYGLGAYLILENQASAGIMIAASVIIRQAMGPVDQVMNTWKQTVEARGAYKRLEALLQKAPASAGVKLPDPQGRVDVEAASLALGGRAVLSNISFGLAPGESLGLVGPSGAGKSSLCRLLLGIWPATSGKVRLDGAEFSQWGPERLGKYIGYLPQDVALFSGTISENIARMGEVDSEAVVRAATLAGMHEMILRMPQGYDTQVGDLGNQLSGGQRQLVGLARVFYGTPRLVVLDEPNSNLDDRGEKILLQSMAVLKQQGVTTVLVTHKPSLLVSADKVLVLKDGQAILFGPRDDVFRALAQANQQAAPAAVSPEQYQ